MSCFQSAGSLFTAVNSRKEATKRHKQLQEEKAAAKAEAKAAEEASKALTLGKSDVQHEYDRNYARIGPQFANGDQIGCMQLMSEMLKMQQQVISVLHSALTGGQLDMNNLALAANTRTDSTISVLNNQYQRMAVAAPIRRPLQPKPRPLPLRRPQLCQEAQRLLLCPSATPRYKPMRMLPDPKNPAKFGRECPSCSSTWNDRPVGLIRDPASKLRYPSDYQFRCHTPVEELYLCYLCGPDTESPVMDGHAELMAHLRTHSQADLLRPAKVSPPARASPPARPSPPASVVDEEYERAWMPSEWKGGYVEERSLPNSPRAAFMKGYSEGKSAPATPNQPDLGKTGYFNDDSIPPSPSPAASLRKAEYAQHRAAPISDVSGHRRGASWNGNPAPYTPQKNVNGSRGWKSAENSPAGSVRGGATQYGGGQSAPNSPPTRYRGAG